VTRAATAAPAEPSHSAGARRAATGEAGTSDLNEERAARAAAAENHPGRGIVIDWTELLRHWSTELMASDLAVGIDPPPASPDWLGYAPATDGDIAALEARLGLPLPPSYAAFLRVSNGWRRTTFAIGRIRPAAEVDLFSVENEEWIEANSGFDDDRPPAKLYSYENGFAPGTGSSHLPHLVQVSDVDDGVYLLNPKAVTPDGEWEAWFFANWVPGAQRYPSFAHLMVAEFRSFRELQKAPTDTWTPPTLPVPPPKTKRTAAKKVAKARVAKTPPPTVDELLSLLELPDVAARRRALRTLAGRLGRHGSWAQPRPDLVGPFSALFDRSTDPAVRAACVSALTEVAPDGAGPPPLLAALSDPDPGVVLSGIFALTYFPDPRAVEPLCRFIESGVNELFNESAMLALAELGDPAAVPTLAKVMTNTASPFDQAFGTAGYSLGRIGGSAALDQLIAALDHLDPRARFAAVVGLCVLDDPRSSALLERMANDPDEKVSQRAKHEIGRWRHDG
jgi:hypothetical protein